MALHVIIDVIVVLLLLRYCGVSNIGGICLKYNFANFEGTNKASKTISMRKEKRIFVHLSDHKNLTAKRDAALRLTTKAYTKPPRSRTCQNPQHGQISRPFWRSKPT
jgi:hypothetical protein